MAEQLLTDDEAAEVLGISLGGLKELVAGGVLHPAGDIGRRFDAAEVEAVLNGTAFQGTEPPADAVPPPELPSPELSQRRVLDPAGVGALYGVDTKTVARWDKKAQLPASFRTPGGHRRFYEDEIMAQLNATVPGPRLPDQAARAGIVPGDAPGQALQSPHKHRACSRLLSHDHEENAHARTPQRGHAGPAVTGRDASRQQ